MKAAKAAFQTSTYVCGMAPTILSRRVVTSHFAPRTDWAARMVCNIVPEARTTARSDDGPTAPVDTGVTVCGGGAPALGEAGEVGACGRLRLN